MVEVDRVGGDIPVIVVLGRGDLRGRGPTKTLKKVRVFAFHSGDDIWRSSSGREHTRQRLDYNRTCSRAAKKTRPPNRAERRHRDTHTHTHTHKRAKTRLDDVAVVGADDDNFLDVLEAYHNTTPTQAKHSLRAGRVVVSGGAYAVDKKRTNNTDTNHQAGRQSERAGRTQDDRD